LDKNSRIFLILSLIGHLVHTIEAEFYKKSLRDKKTVIPLYPETRNTGFAL